MNKLKNALACLGIDANTFGEWKADVKTHRLVTENGLLPATNEDVRDEFEQLDTEVDADPIDEDDENQIDMKAISPTMRELYQ
tara:strand:+ start:2583 stop:2831 length:249 start_codon:yes stop_codon:yes gene_type:complete